jgi:aminoglycoside/choline kinase family phosphotransferase
LTDPQILELVYRILESPWDRMPGGGFTRSASVERITGGGSDRQFFRVIEDGLSAVVLVHPGGGDEFERYLRTGDFLRENGIGVPDFYTADDSGIVIMEDLGDIHLLNALEGADAQAELAFYRDCIDMLYRLQTSVTAAELEAGILGGMVFTEETLLAETEYFAREFVEGYAGIDRPSGWDGERRYLAGELASYPQVFMHRDFQSRNILVKDGRLRLVDFQTAHRGPGMYDTASILKDPYHPIDPGTRKTLLMELYYRFIGDGPEPEGGFEMFDERFVLAGIQRNMQALAAFAFLGIKKKRDGFVEFIRPGLGLLEEGLTESGMFPETSGLIARIRDKIIERNE